MFQTTLRYCDFLKIYSYNNGKILLSLLRIRLSRIQLKFREISSCFILETDFRFKFLVQNWLRTSSTYGKEKGHFD